MIKYSNEKVISTWDLDKLVEETYGRTYNFQQQDGCQERGSIHVSVPDEVDDDELPNSIPEVINGEEMGVNFKAWLERDPKQPIEGQTADYELELFWERNFYPPLQTVLNDLHEKGLIEAGDYTIKIDW